MTSQRKLKKVWINDEGIKISLEELILVFDFLKSLFKEDEVLEMNGSKIMACTSNFFEKWYANIVKFKPRNGDILACLAGTVQ